MRAMCTSALVEETAFETRLGLSYLPSEMLRHRHCQGFPRSRVELALAPVSVVVDMRDMATINTLTVSATKGKKNDTFCAVYIYTCVILPRQARDKHRENSKKSAVFLPAGFDTIFPVDDMLEAIGNERKNGVFFHHAP